MPALKPLSDLKSLSSTATGAPSMKSPVKASGMSGRNKPRAHFAKPFTGMKQSNSGIGKPLSLSNQKGNQY